MQVFHVTVSSDRTITVTNSMLEAVGKFKDDMGLTWDFILKLPLCLMIFSLDYGRELQVPFEPGTKLLLSYNPFRGQFLTVEE